jgi:hypothetical protein
MRGSFKLLMVPTVLIVAGAASAQVERDSGRGEKALPARINLRVAKVVEIRDDAGRVVLSGTFSRNTAVLSSKDAGATAHGMAEIEIENEGAAIKQEIEVKVKKLPAHATFKLIVDGNEIAAFTTSKSGKRALKYSRKEIGSPQARLPQS